MTDSSNTLTQSLVLGRIQRKSLDIEQLAKDDILEAVGIFVSSLVSTNFAKATIVPPLRVFFINDPNTAINTGAPNEFSIDFKGRSRDQLSDVELQRQQKTSLYLDEVLVFLDIVGDWLVEKYGENTELFNAITKHSDITSLDTWRTQLQLIFSRGPAGNDTFHEFYETTIAREWQKIFNAAKVLLTEINKLDGNIVPQTFGFNSLTTLLSQLEDEKRAAEFVLDRDAWVGTFLPLLQAIQQPTRDGDGRQVVHPQEKPSLYTGSYEFNGNFSPLEVKQLFHLFIERGLRTVVKNPQEENSQLEKNTKLKRIEQVLSEEEIERINNSSSDFYIEGVDNIFEALVANEETSDSDQRAFEKLFRFLETDDAVMRRLIGDKKKEIAAPPGAEAEAPSESGGTDDTPPQPPKQFTYDQLKQYIVEQLALQLLSKTPGFAQLAFTIATQEQAKYPGSHSLYKNLLNATITELLSDNYPDLAIQLDPQTLRGVAQFDEATGTYSLSLSALQNILPTVIGDLIKDLEPIFTDKFKAELEGLEEKITSAIESDDVFNAQEQTEKQLSNKNVSDTLGSLVSDYKKSQDLAVEMGIPLTLEDKARYNDIYLGAANIFTPFIIRNLLEDRGFKDISVEDFMRTNPELVLQISEYFKQSLDADKAAALFFGDYNTRSKLLAELRLEVLKDTLPLIRPQFEQLLTQTKQRLEREQHLTGINTRFSEAVVDFASSQNELIDLVSDQNLGAVPGSLNQKLTTMVGLISQMDDPADYLTRLSPDQLFELFGVRFTSESEFHAFKGKLIQHVGLFQIIHHGLPDVSSDDLTAAGIKHTNQVKIFSSRPGSAPTPSQLKDVGTLVDAAGGFDSWNQQLQSPYGEDTAADAASNGADSAEIAFREHWEQQKKNMLLAVWQNMAAEQQQLMLAQLGAAAQAEYEAQLLAAGAAGAVPGGLTLGGALGFLNAQEAANGVPQETLGSRMGAAWDRFRGRDTQKPKNVAGNFAKQAAETAVKMGLNSFVPGMGTAAFAVSDAVKGVTGLDRKQQVAAGLGVAGLGLGFLWYLLTQLAAKVGSFLATIGSAVAGGLIGGGIGFAVGGPAGALIGGGIGAGLGGYAGYNAANGNLLGLGSTTTQVGGQGAFGSGAATTGTAFLPNLGASAPIIAGVSATSAAVIFSTVSVVSLIKPLPTISGDQISPYVEIIKTASPGIEFTNDQLPQEITYTISIRAKVGYDLTITDVSDVMSYKLNTETRQNVPNPAVPLARTLADFGQQAPLEIASGETVLLGTYTQTFGPEFQDANVINTVTATFTVAQGLGYVEGQSVPIPSSPQTALTAESICFGECPQSQGGCWPVEGYVTQEPFSGTSFHRTSDSIDIGTPEGNPVYSPFNGTIIQYSNSESASACAVYGCTGDPNYGISVMITTSISGEDNAQFILAHLRMIEPDVLERGTVSVGEKIGESGNTGNSTGPHLHYEYWSNRGGSSSILRTLVPEGKEARQVCGS